MASLRALLAEQRAHSEAAEKAGYRLIVLVDLLPNHRVPEVFADAGLSPQR